MSKHQINVLDNIPSDIIIYICELLPNDRNRINLLRVNKHIYSYIRKILMHDPVNLFCLINNKYIDNFTHIKLFYPENNISHTNFIDECIQINDLLNMHVPPIKFPTNMITLELKIDSLNLLVSNLPRNIKTIKISSIPLYYYHGAKITLIVPHTCRELSIDNYVIIPDLMLSSITHLTLKHKRHHNMGKWITAPTKYIVPTRLTYLKMIGNVHINTLPKSLIELDISNALCSYADLDKMLHHDISKKKSYTITKLHIDNINTSMASRIPDTVIFLYIDGTPSDYYVNDYKSMPKNITTCIINNEPDDIITNLPENVSKVYFQQDSLYISSSVTKLKIPAHIMYVEFNVRITDDVNIDDLLCALIDNYDNSFISKCTHEYTSHAKYSKIYRIQLMRI